MRFVGIKFNPWEIANQNGIGASKLIIRGKNSTKRDHGTGK